MSDELAAERQALADQEAQARQLLPEPVPFELDSLFIRALEHYRSEPRGGGLPLGRDGEPLEDSIGRLLWAALSDASAMLRRGNAGPGVER